MSGVQNFLQLFAVTKQKHVYDESSVKWSLVLIILVEIIYAIVYMTNTVVCTPPNLGALTGNETTEHVPDLSFVNKKCGSEEKAQFAPQLLSTAIFVVLCGAGVKIFSLATAELQMACEECNKEDTIIDEAIIMVDYICFKFKIYKIIVLVLLLFTAIGSFVFTVTEDGEVLSEFSCGGNVSWMIDGGFPPIRFACTSTLSFSLQFISWSILVFRVLICLLIIASYWQVSQFCGRRKFLEDLASYEELPAAATMMEGIKGLLGKEGEQAHLFRGDRMPPSKADLRRGVAATMAALVRELGDGSVDERALSLALGRMIGANPLIVFHSGALERAFETGYTSAVASKLGQDAFSHAHTPLLSGGA